MYSHPLAHSVLTTQEAYRRYLEARDDPTSTQEARNALWATYCALAAFEMYNKECEKSPTR